VELELEPDSSFPEPCEHPTEQELAPTPDLGFRFADPRARSQSSACAKPQQMEDPEPPLHVLHSDWTEAYNSSAEWSEIWRQTQDTDDWQENFQVSARWLFKDGKLCVPESLVADVLAALHENAGHLGAERLAIEAKRRCALPHSVNLTQTAVRVKRLCPTCQECEPPNWSLSQPIRMAPIPETVLEHQP